MKICVIGAGVIGCATAFELQRQGHEVLLLEAAAGPGLGTSFANGGQLSYSYVEPLASPSTLRALPTLFFGRQSPVRFRLRPDPVQIEWGLRFLAACRRVQTERGTHELLRIAALSRQVLDEWLSEFPFEFAFRRNGKLVICPDLRSLAHQQQVVRRQTYAGTPQEVVDRAGCLRHEPALAAYEGFVGGVWTPSECVGDPHAYCRELMREFRDRGGEVQWNTPVQALAQQGGRVRAALTPRGPVEAQTFVLCTGVRARELARQVGERLPVYPIKGYSLTLKIRDPGRAPAVSVTDLARKAVFAPLGGKLRVAAMAEVVGDDLHIPPARLASMLDSVERLYPGLCEHDDAKPWAGLRPATPTSVPIIRSSRVSNLVLNVGHGPLGFTLAAGSARMVGELVLQRRAEAVLPRLDLPQAMETG